MTTKNQRIVSPQLFGCFCITELLLLVVLKLAQTFCPFTLSGAILMFSSILINALFMLLLVSRVKKSGKDTRVTGIPLAVFTTLLADLFLVFLHDLSNAGVVHFITPLACNMIGFSIFGIVQVIYACYLGFTKRRVMIRVGFYLYFILSITAAGLLTFDRFIACLSMSQLILNLVYVWIEHYRKRTVASRLLAVGITLFFGCDFFIMLRMLLPPQGFLYGAICFMVWVFYIPSQILLTSSYFADRTVL